MAKTIIAYTDGSAVVAGVNKGKGGFGAYFPDFYGERVGISQGFKKTKTGRMEIMALLAVINHFKIDHHEPVILSVFSDSQYVVKSFTDKRLEKWASNGWQNSSGNVKNRDLWEKILTKLEERPFLILDMNWIRGHQLDKCKCPIEKAELKNNPHVVGNTVADSFADVWRTQKNLKKDL